MELYEYTVEGRGDFPTDMLRYDMCWPVDGDAVSALIGTERREVRLRGIARPTTGRWSSFLWAVQEPIFHHRDNKPVRKLNRSGLVLA